MIEAFTGQLALWGRFFCQERGLGKTVRHRIIICISLINPEHEKLADVHVGEVLRER